MSRRRASKEWYCKACGHIHRGPRPPDQCPACGTAQDSFELMASSEGEAADEGPRSLSDRVQDLVIDHHIHPVIAHAPNGIIPMAVAFMILAEYLHHPLLNTAALYSLGFVLLTLPVVIASGVTIWRWRYRGAMTRLFVIKMAAAAVATLSLSAIVVWRVLEPGVMDPGSPHRWAMLVLALVLLAAVSVAGYLGGQLVFNSRPEPQSAPAAVPQPAGPSFLTVHPFSVYVELVASRRSAAGGE